MLTAFLYLLLLAPANAGPIDHLESSWASRGYHVRERTWHKNRALVAFAAILTPKDAKADALEVYVLVKGKSYLGYSHPSQLDRLEFEPTSLAGFTDYFKDGSRTLAYRSIRPSTSRMDLNILRWKDFKIERVAVFPEGRMVLLGDNMAVAASELPLGRYLSIGCENFGTISRTAFKTSLYTPRGGRFADVTRDFPSYFEAEIARKRKAIDRLREDLEKNAGDYLGLALSIYYDFAAMGRAREGWNALRGYFELPPGAPGAAKSCMAEMEGDLRGQLGIPADWP